MRTFESTVTIGCLIGLVLLLPADARAGTIGLRWDRVPEATGYRVHYGTSAGQYTQHVDVGNVDSVDLGGLGDCTTYFLAVKAYNRQGESTGFSNEVSGWPHPEISSLEPGTTRQGSQVTVEFSGANFRSGAELIIDAASIPVNAAGEPLVRLDDVTVLSCTRIQALMTVEPTARGIRAMEVGAFPLGVEVRNPDAVFGARSHQLQILFDPARADINRSDTSTQDRVDGEDLVWLAHAYGSSEGEVHHNPDADLDGDGLVDGEDLASLAARFGACWNGEDWSEDACP